jgi:hypothetical protein
VSGWTKNRPRRAADKVPFNPASTARSAGCRAGRTTCRRRTATAWRRMTTSMARSSCPPRETSQLEQTDEDDVEEGERHASSSSPGDRKSRSMEPDDVFGTHRNPSHLPAPSQIAAARSAFSIDHYEPRLTVVVNDLCIFRGPHAAESRTTCTTAQPEASNPR